MRRRPLTAAAPCDGRYFCFVLRQLSGSDDRPTDSEDGLDLPLTAGIKSVPSLVCSSALSEGRYQFHLVLGRGGAKLCLSLAEGEVTPSIAGKFLLILLLFQSESS